MGAVQAKPRATGTRGRPSPARAPAADGAGAHRVVPLPVGEVRHNARARRGIPDNVE
ncbi:hypothetical protein GCM10027073_40120 [Streptomyces chlorus]